MPKIPPQHLVVGSRVEGLFNEVDWFPGKIEAIRPGKNGSKQIVVLYDDGSQESNWPQTWMTSDMTKRKTSPKPTSGISVTISSMTNDSDGGLVNLALLQADTTKVQNNCNCCRQVSHLGNAHQIQEI